MVSIPAVCHALQLPFASSCVCRLSSNKQSYPSPHFPIPHTLLTGPRSSHPSPVRLTCMIDVSLVCSSTCLYLWKQVCPSADCYLVQSISAFPVDFRREIPKKFGVNHENHHRDPVPSVRVVLQHNRTASDTHPNPWRKPE